MKTQTSTRKILIYVITVLLTLAITLLSLASCSDDNQTIVDKQNKILLLKLDYTSTVFEEGQNID